MELVIASNNAHKLREIRAILGGSFDPIYTLRDLDVTHETVEDGETFMDNALKKAREIAAITGRWALADDSGICVDTLGGAPGVHSARFCGRHGDDEANNQLMLERMAQQADRRAHYACAIALVSPQGEEITAEGRMEGEITQHPAGEHGFGYDPLFYLPQYGCTAAQLDPEVKNAISHRALALQALLAKWQTR